MNFAGVRLGSPASRLAAVFMARPGLGGGAGMAPSATPLEPSAQISWRAVIVSLNVKRRNKSVSCWGRSDFPDELGGAQLSLPSADGIEDADQVLTRFHVPADDGGLRLFERELEASQLA